MLVPQLLCFIGSCSHPGCSGGAFAAAATRDGAARFCVAHALRSVGRNCSYGVFSFCATGTHGRSLSAHLRLNIGKADVSTFARYPSSVRDARVLRACNARCAGGAPAPARRWC